MQDGVVRLVGMLHGNGLRKLSQHPLLEVLKPLVVITTTDKLLVLQKEDSGGPVNWYPVTPAETAIRDSKRSSNSETLRMFGGGLISAYCCQV